MLILVLTAFVLISLTIFIHGVGTTSWLRFLIHRHQGASEQFRPKKTISVLISTAIVLVTLHLIEIFVWAVAYLFVISDSNIQTMESAFYFSTVTFTTVGYGDITLSSDWRLLSGLEAINGILLVGWTTAFLFSVLQRAWQSPGNNNEKSN